jgi:hypothetical protein
VASIGTSRSLTARSRRPAIALSACLLGALLLPACGGDERSDGLTPEARLRATNTCEHRAAGSRWARGDGRYAMMAEFGRAEEERLVQVAGVVPSPAGEVLVYDILAPRILRLDHDLRLAGAFGRRGRGPGEIVYQPSVMPSSWIAAADTSIFVLDLLRLSEFDLAGRFRGYATPEPPFALPVTHIAVRHGRIVYAVDDIDHRDGRRSLQTWRMEERRPHTLLRIDSMPSLPLLDGRPQRGLLVMQADPLWAVHGRCAFISDGAGEWILRVDLDTNRADTLRLPSREPARLAPEDEASLAHLRRAIMPAERARRLTRVRPTARLKWAGLLVDPDGYVWLEPWRPTSAEQDPFAVWVIHPATGVVDSVVVERFPGAFLPDGGFVSRAYDPTERQALVRKYSFTSERERTP